MRTGPTNQSLVTLIQELRTKAISGKVNLWKRLAEELIRSRRQRRIVNLMHIAKNAKHGEIIVVPGKVLGMGDLDQKLTIAAYQFSGSALDKIKQSGGEAMTIQELMEKNPNGNKVRIIG